MATAVSRACNGNIGLEMFEAFLQSCAEFPLEYFVVFNILIMFTRCFKEECGHIGHSIAYDWKEGWPDSPPPRPHESATDHRRRSASKSGVLRFIAKDQFINASVLN